MAEKGIVYELVRESPWTSRDEFLDLNPAGMTPVLVADDGGATLADSQAICEYFEETLETFPLISGSALARAEIRRLVAWFDQIVYRDVVAPLLNERMIKRVVSRTSPDAGALREAMRKANTHMDYMDYLLDHRSWMAGGTMSLADIAAAAHISVADYLGGIDWEGHKPTKRWYAGIKSRPSLPAAPRRAHGKWSRRRKYYDQPDFLIGGIFLNPRNPMSDPKLFPNHRDWAVGVMKQKQGTTSPRT